MDPDATQSLIEEALPGTGRVRRRQRSRADAAATPADNPRPVGADAILAAAYAGELPRP
jgi:hypothetical protein